MAKKILIFGLPGAGKSTLSEFLVEKIQNIDYFNADEIRTRYNDWDFSPEGRKRQSERMKSFAENSKQTYAICDFVAPTKNIRDLFNADFSIWVDTIQEGRFEDTNKVFVAPQTQEKINIHITSYNYDVEYIIKLIKETLER
jgi:adenylylsulfate kinase